MGKERVKKNPGLLHWVKFVVSLTKILGTDREIDLDHLQRIQCGTNGAGVGCEYPPQDVHR